MKKGDFLLINRGKISDEDKEKLKVTFMDFKDAVCYVRNKLDEFDGDIVSDEYMIDEIVMRMEDLEIEIDELLKEYRAKKYELRLLREGLKGLELQVLKAKEKKQFYLGILKDVVWEYAFDDFDADEEIFSYLNKRMGNKTRNRIKNKNNKK